MSWRNCRWRQFAAEFCGVILKDGTTTNRFRSSYNLKTLGYKSYLKNGNCTSTVSIESHIWFGFFWRKWSCTDTKHTMKANIEFWWLLLRRLTDVHKIVAIYSRTKKCTVRGGTLRWLIVIESMCLVIKLLAPRF